MSQEMKTQVRAAAVQWVNEMIYQNQIAVEDVEDAMYYALTQIKDQIIINLSTQILQHEMEHAAANEEEDLPIEKGEISGRQENNNDSGDEVLSGD